MSTPSPTTPINDISDLSLIQTSIQELQRKINILQSSPNQNKNTLLPDLTVFNSLVTKTSLRWDISFANVASFTVSGDPYLIDPVISPGYSYSLQYNGLPLSLSPPTYTPTLILVNTDGFTNLEPLTSLTQVISPTPSASVSSTSKTLTSITWNLSLTNISYFTISDGPYVKSQVNNPGSSYTLSYTGLTASVSPTSYTPTLTLYNIDGVSTSVTLSSLSTSILPTASASTTISTLTSIRWDLSFANVVSFTISGDPYSIGQVNNPGNSYILSYTDLSMSSYPIAYSPRLTLVNIDGFTNTVTITSATQIASPPSSVTVTSTSSTSTFIRWDISLVNVVSFTISGDPYSIGQITNPGSSYTLSYTGLTASTSPTVYAPVLSLYNSDNVLALSTLSQLSTIPLPSLNITVSSIL